jgi:ATP-dependent Clp protease ATP-binding subunit ClpB
VDGDVPENLKDKIVYSLDMGALLPVPNTKENLKNAKIRMKEVTSPKGYCFIH